MAERRIDILINTKNNNAGIKSAENDLKSLASAAGQLSGGLSGLAGLVGVAGIVGLGVAAGGAAVELARSSAEAARTRTAFDNLAANAGESGNQMLEAMQRASHGMVSNADLVASANRAMLLGVASSGEQLGQLLEVASARGKAMGLSTQQAFGDLVTGIGRMSPMILDNLGIVTGGEKVFQNYAQSIGTTADKLTDAEKKQALFNAVMQSSQGLIDANSSSGEDLASKFERMDASIANAKQALGELFAPAVAAIAQSLADSVDILIEKLKEMPKQAPLPIAVAAEPYIKAAQAAEQAASAYAATNDHLEENRAHYGSAAEKAKEFAEAQARARQEAESFKASLANSPAVFQAMANAALAAGVSIDELKRTMSEAKKEFGQLQSARDSAVSALASAAARNNQFVGPDQSRKLYQDGIKQVDRQVEVLSQRLADGTLTSEDFAYQLAFVGQNATSAFDKLEEDRRATEKWAESAGKDLNQAFEDLKGKVSGVLGEALSADVGVNPDDILPRTDAINENARRLADIAVNGYKSPWLAYFQQEFPDLFQQFFAGAAGDEGLKQQAAQLIKNFQDGLEPELLDKEAAKDKVRRMLVGEQNMNALAQEIAQELSGEFGNVAPTDIAALAQDALGGGKLGKSDNAGGGAGSALAAGLQEGLAGAGNTAMANLAAELKNENNLKLMIDAGKSGGVSWGQGFMQTVGANIPQQLLDLLATLVTPMVQGNLSQQAALQGAK